MLFSAPPKRVKYKRGRVKIYISLLELNDKELGFKAVNLSENLGLKVYLPTTR